MKRVPLEELSFSFSRSSGPGGQNVNKTNTKVTMTWSMSRTACYTNAHRERFIEKYKRLIIGGDVMIKSQRYRSQSKNIEDCKDKLYELLFSVFKPALVRRPTKPSRKKVEKRLNEKKKHSLKKNDRRKNFD